jgi:beta-glucosidase
MVGRPGQTTLTLVTVLIIGTNSEWESEGYDRDDFKLPRRTDDLVRAVLAATPNAIIVNQSGMPVELPWLAQTATLLQAFFGGNECGTAIADAVFGKINPSGKLPTTWPVRLEDFPSHEGFGHPKDTVYHEGLSVGYRYFDRKGNPKSAFPFGYGLSYTSFNIR